MLLFIKAALNYRSVIMLLFWSVQARQCLCSTVYGSIVRVLVLLVSHSPLHVDYYIKEFAIIASYNSSLGNTCIEACYRCFVASHK